MENRLSAPVGDTKCKDPKPLNKAKDITTLEIWLIAQGARYQMKGSMNSDLVKWIKVYQGSKGKLPKDKVNGVIEPGDKTWNAGAVDYFRYRDKINSFEAYEVKEGGKVKRVTVDEFVRLETEARRKIINNAKAVISECDVIEKLIRSIEETMAGQEGFVNAMAALASSGFGLAPPPSTKAALNARGSAQMVISATDRTTVDWKKVKALCEKTQKLHKKAVKEWTDYNKAHMKRSEWGAFGANIVSEGAFGTLEVLATGYLVTTRGMNPKQAQILAATGVEGLKTSAGELGEYAANDKFDPEKSAVKVTTNMIIAGVSASVGVTLSSKAFGKVVGKVAAQATKQFSGKLAQYSVKIVEKILTSPVGQNLIASATAEMGNILKDVRDGKKVDEKRIVDAIAASVSGGLFASAPFKSLKKFDNTWQNRSDRIAQQHFQKILDKKLTLKLVARNPKETVQEMMKKDGAEIVAGTVRKLSDTMTKIVYAEIAEKITGKETSAADIEKKAMKALEKDTAFISAMEIAALEDAEKRLAKMQPAR